MKYLDTGSRDPEQALAKWLASLIAIEIEELRIQSGFFGIGGIGLLLPIFKSHVDSGKTTKILIGSNDGGTLRADVLSLASFMGIPRANASLGVVSFANAYFHPKTYHVRRADGSQAAYVGSANLSAAGLSLHVEAGITLDTRDGDDIQRLLEIAHAIDAWFDEGRDGLHLIQDIESVEALVGAKVLAPAPKPKVSSKDGAPTSVAGLNKPKLKPVFALPPVETQEAAPADEPSSDDSEEAPGVQDAALPPPASGSGAAPGVIVSSTPATVSTPPPLPPAVGAVRTAVPKSGFPQYLLFDPTATVATFGASALTGTALPSGAVGLIVQLNLDSARHFMGRTGTANISIPVATIGSIRFGVSGVHSRPRAEFPLRFRFVAGTTIIDGGAASTNIQGYGYTALETGHGDLRMLVPAEIRAFGETINKAGHMTPTNGDYALLEWPTPADAIFRLTFVESGTALANSATAAFTTALTAGQVVGQGACWLQHGLSPSW